MKKLYSHKSGQALVTLLIFIIVAISITSAATVLIVNSTLSTSNVEESLLAHQIAESGVENAVLRLLRDPSYAGETLAIANGTATVTVTGTTTKTITSIGRFDNYLRTVQVVANYSTILTITSWKEIW